MTVKFQPTRNREFVKRAFADFNGIPEAWLQQLVSYLEANPPLLPASQISGIQLASAKLAAPVNDIDTISSTSYTDPTHAGPTISGLPPGMYGILWGAAVTTTTNVAGTSGYFGPGINGADPSDAESLLVTSATNAIPAFAAKSLAKTLTADSNTVKIRYRNASSADANTSTFGYRWLVVFRQGSA